MKYKRLKPYIRRMKCSDHSYDGDIFINDKLESFSSRGEKLYVLVVHGIPNAVFMINTEKVGIKKYVNRQNHYKVSFNQWCRDMRAQNKERGL